MQSPASTSSPVISIVLDMMAFEFMCSKIGSRGRHSLFLWITQTVLVLVVRTFVVGPSIVSCEVARASSGGHGADGVSNAQQDIGLVDWICDGFHFHFDAPTLSSKRSQYLLHWITSSSGQCHLSIWSRLG